MIVCSTSLLFSCSADFLDSAPITELVDANFYKTEKDAEMAIIACYDGLQLVWGDGVALPIASDIMSDDCFGATGNGDGYGYQLIDEFDPSRSPSDLNVYNQNWVYYYKALYRCNMLISKLDGIAWTSTENRAKIEAQARFIRANLLFDMVRLWGNICLVLEPLNSDQYYMTQSNPTDVYKAIVQDLLFAADNGYLKNEKWTKSWASANDGRVNVYAAKALLARVYLFYTGYYAKDDLGITKAQVIDHLEDVYETSSGYKLVSDFSNLWPAACSTPDASDAVIGLKTTYAGEGNSETIWSIKFNSTGNWTGSTDGYIGMKMLSMRNGCYTPGNGKIYGAEGWGGATVCKELYTGWANTDPRRKASIIDVTAEGLTYNSDDQREYTGYFNKKYTSLANPQTGKGFLTSQSLDFQINPYQDFIVIRYADVLLMLSELKADASYMNEVRNRAGLLPVAYSDENLRTERRHELAFEGIRYWDLLRYGLNYAADKIAYTGMVKNGGVDTRKTISRDVFLLTKGLSQLPQTQIGLMNGSLVQNTGWE